MSLTSQLSHRLAHNELNIHFRSLDKPLFHIPPPFSTWFHDHKLQFGIPPHPVLLQCPSGAIKEHKEVSRGFWTLNNITWTMAGRTTNAYVWKTLYKGIDNVRN